MQDFNNRYSQSQYQQEYSNEYDMELNPEFDMENEYDNEYNSNYESEESFEMENDYESNYEMDPEFDMEEEADYENSYNMEFDNEENEFQEEYESQKDEMEAELEYVTNEDEFNNWVNEVVVRTNPGLRRTLRTPIGQRAVKQFSKIAFRTLPYIGRKRSGWKRPYHKHRPHHHHHRKHDHRRWRHRRPGWRNTGMPYQSYLYPNIPQQQPGFPNQDMQQQPQGFQNQGMPQQQQGFQNQGMPQQAPGFQNPGMSQQAGGFQNSTGQQQPQIEQDGSFKNFVMDTIKNLSEQIAKGNESIEALKKSMTNSAVNNFPAIVQPKTDSPDQPAPPSANSPTPPATDTTAKEPAATGEYEWEDNEYNYETNDEYDNEEAYEYNYETDGEISDGESGFNEETEMELASELLSLNSEMELDYFFGKLAKKLLKKGVKFLMSPQGKILRKALKKIVGKALPIVGGIVGGPAGAAVGSSVGSAVAGDDSATPVASEYFNLELEGLSNEDSEFEIAKAIVRFAGNAVKEAHDNETGNPVKDAEHALIRSARRFAPGLLRPRGNGYVQNNFSDYGGNQNNDNMGMSDNGRWYRRGNNIIIQNAF